MDLHLNVDGPHDDDSIRQTASAMAECVRVLNHATRDPDAVKYPATVHDVLGSLRDGVQRMDQLFRQLDDRLRSMAVQDRIGDTHGDPFQVVASVRRQLDLLRTDAAVMAERLDRAFNASSGLYLREDGGS
ncbi:hypothetical protein ACBJ59_11020 [Nonomuraea sp. MTCD27]|uniref:hypothetical protein n=1 Tax=Nonomuraea sp. MTCD27 TaxID=1676747 RepID=UPI0035C11F23